MKTVILLGVVLLTLSLAGYWYFFYRAGLQNRGVRLAYTTLPSNGPRGARLRLCIVTSLFILGLALVSVEPSPGGHLWDIWRVSAGAVLVISLGIVAPISGHNREVRRRRDHP